MLDFDAKKTLNLINKLIKGVTKMNNNIKLNKNKLSFSQCNRMIKEINKSFSINDIPIKLQIHKSLIQNIKEKTIYKLLVFNLNTRENKTQGSYTLPELQNYLFKHFKTIN